MLNRWTKHPLSGSASFERMDAEAIALDRTLAQSHVMCFWAQLARAPMICDRSVCDARRPGDIYIAQKSQRSGNHGSAEDSCGRGCRSR